MNIYLYAVCTDTENNILKLGANSLKHAEEKLYNKLFDKYEWAESNNLDDLLDELWDEGIRVSNLYEIEDFN